MTDLRRRDVLLSLGWGALALGAGGSRVAAWAQPRAGRGADLEPLVRKILRTPRAAVLELAEELVRSGVGWRELEAAIFLAAVREVRPRPPGSLSHAILLAEPVFQLAEAGPAGEELLPVLFHLDELKRSQERDAERGDWMLPLPPAASGDLGEEQARAELARALASFDGERADRAVTALFRRAGADATFAALWPAVVRDFGGLGHKAILGAHSASALARIGPEHGEPVVRALAWSLTEEFPRALLDDDDAAREAARGFPAAWRSGAEGPDASLALARALVAAGPAGAREAIVAAVADGLGARGAWDGVRLAACDLFARGPALLSVHPITVTAALFQVQRRAADELTRRAALLQAATWIPRVRDVLADNELFDPRSSALDELARPAGDLARASADPQAHPSPSETPDELAGSLDATFAAPSLARVRAHVERHGPAAFSARLLAHLHRAATDSHQPKLAAALLGEARHVHPRWVPTLFSPALGYLPAAAALTTPLHERSRELLARAAG